MFPSNFRPEPFTQEELARFTKALSKGRVVDVIGLVSELTPEKELEIQKLVNHFSPVFKGYENKVKGFLSQLQTKEELQITDPQQEEKIDLLIRKELDSVKTKNKLEAALNELNSLKAATVEESSRIQETIKEHKRMLKALEVSLAKDLTLENVRDILKSTPEKVEHIVPPKELPKNEETKKEEPTPSKVEESDGKGKLEEPVVEKPAESAPEVESPVEPLLESSTSKEEPLPKAPIDVASDTEKVKEEKSTKPIPEAVVGSKIKECCGSKGFKHKKLCPLKK